MVDDTTGNDNTPAEPVILTGKQAFEARRKALYEQQKEKARAHRKAQYAKLKAARKESRKADKISANEAKKAAIAERDRALREAIMPAAKLEPKLRLVRDED